MTKRKSYIVLEILFYIVLAIGGLYNVFSPMLLSNFAVIQPSNGDTIFNAIILEHVFQAFFNGDYAGSFYHPLFFYPMRYILTFSDNLLGAAPIYWFLRIFIDAMTAFQWWELITVALSYFAFVYFLRWLKINPYISGVVAFIFTYGAFKVVDTAHPQIFPQFFTFIFLIYMLRFLRAPTLRDFNLMMLFLYLNALAGYYLGWFLIFSLFFFLPLYILTDRTLIAGLGQFLTHNKRLMVKYSILWVLAFILFWWPYIYTSLNVRYSINNLNYTVTNLIDVSKLYLPPPGGLYQKFLRIKIPENSKMFIWGYGGSLFQGLFGLLIVYVGYSLFLSKKLVAFTEKSLAKALYLTGLIILVMAFKVGKYSLWYLVWGIIPGSDGIRTVTRIWIIAFVYLFTAVALYLNRVTWPKHPVWLSFALVIFVVEQIVLTKPSVSKEPFLIASHDMAVMVRDHQCDVFYYRHKLDEKLYIVQSLIAMNASIEANVPTINGYSGIMNPLIMGDTDVQQLAKVLGDKYQGKLCYFNPEYSETNEIKSVTVSEHNFPLQ
jgi:hypothetical protein